MHTDLAKQILPVYNLSARSSFDLFQGDTQEVAVEVNSDRWHNGLLPRTRSRSTRLGFLCPCLSQVSKLVNTESSVAKTFLHSLVLELDKCQAATSQPVATVTGRYVDEELNGVGFRVFLSAGLPSFRDLGHFHGFHQHPDL